MPENHTEILIVGGGLGGVAAALAALRLGKRVILTEETDWLGGQMTAQGVPPDEHPWIEQTGCTASYRRLRDGIRDYYRRYYPLKPEVSANPAFNPGQGNVSFLCHEPRVSEMVLNGMLAPYRSARQLQVLLNHRPVAVEMNGDKVQAVTLEILPGREKVTLRADYILDATEQGELLPLGEVEHVTGSESQAQTGEPHALPGAPDPLDQQAFTVCFAIDYLPNENFTIPKPAEYDFWRTYRANFWADRLLSWTYTEPIDLSAVTRPIFGGPTEKLDAMDLWHYRRILFSQHYPAGLYASDITLVNWPQNDYWLGPLVGVSPETAAQNLVHARQLSLSFLYWMQVEAPRLDGGYGYRGLRLRGDVLDTSDGLAKNPYIRESRRIQAEFTVLEQHVAIAARGSLQGAEPFADSVGIGTYRIDLHPSSSGRNYIDIPSWPFQIPLGALLPVRVENLLPASKNLGVTHITNGCYREHPTEWNIGESAGTLAAYCLEYNTVPRQVRHDQVRLHDFQHLLTNTLGIQLAWPEEIRLTPRDKANPLGF